MHEKGYDDARVEVSPHFSPSSRIAEINAPASVEASGIVLRRRASSSRSAADIGRPGLRTAGDDPRSLSNQEFPPDPLLLRLGQPGGFRHGTLKRLRHAAIVACPKARAEPHPAPSRASGARS